MNKKNRIFIIVILIFIVATGVWLIWDNKNLETFDNIDTYQKREVIEIKINDNVEICTNQLPFSILNPNGKALQLKHSCTGFVGSGIDQYCENGKKIIEDVDILCDFSDKWCRGCSDAIVCGKQNIRESFLWDQKEYITLTEECEGQSITRQEKQQVPSGSYKIIVDGEVTGEFIIK